MHGSFHLRKSGWRVPKLKAQHSESNSNTVIQDSESDSNSSCDPEVSIENSVWDIKSCILIQELYVSTSMCFACERGKMGSSILSPTALMKEWKKRKLEI